MLVIHISKASWDRGPHLDWSTCNNEGCYGDLAQLMQQNAISRELNCMSTRYWYISRVTMVFRSSHVQGMYAMSRTVFWPSAASTNSSQTKFLKAYNCWQHHETVEPICTLINSCIQIIMCLRQSVWCKMICFQPYQQAKDTETASSRIQVQFPCVIQFFSLHT